jgi:ankyrin repeat protein
VDASRTELATDIKDARPNGVLMIDEDARNGDLNFAYALLLDSPDLVSSKDFTGETPLHWAAFGGSKDVAELLRQHGGYE